MRPLAQPVFASLLLFAPAVAQDAVPVAATIETTLSTGSGQIRQFAFDGDSSTFFASVESPGGADHFTLLFDRPVALKGISVATGRTDQKDRLDPGTLEASVDGKTFGELLKLSGGMARRELDGPAILAIRLRPAGDLNHPLVIRELSIESDPPVAVFKYPVEIAMDVTDAPDMKEWAEKVARICERAFPMINEELRSEGFKPRHLISMSLKESYRGVAAASGGRITGSVKYFREHPDDVGAMVHETVHTVQGYRGKVPSWLREGICDYVRFFKFEPGNLGRINRDRARYDRSYRVTAAFLAYLTEKHDREIVLKLNRILREGQYREEVFKQLTGKTAEELNEEWLRSIRRARF